MARHPPNDDTEGVLGRWARRKAEARVPRTAPQTPATGEPAAEPAPADRLPPAADETPPKTDADMPPLESIDERSDVSDFFSPGVSDTLRQAALRKLFRLPKFNVVDELDDYNDDFTTFAALGDIITADMRHRAEVEAERLKEKAQQALADDDQQDRQPAEDAAADAEQVPAENTGEPGQQRQSTDSQPAAARAARGQPPAEDDPENT